MGDTEIFNKAQQSEDEYKIGELKDRISTVILDWETEKRIPETAESTDLEDLWGKFVDADIIDNPEEDIYNQEGTDIYEVTTNEGYVVEIIVKEDGTVEIGDIEKEENLLPSIEKIVSSSNTNSIHIEVEVRRVQEGDLSYYYKKEGELDTSYITLKEGVTEQTADFTRLEQNIVYNIKVVARNENGSTEKVINERTGELEEGTITQIQEPEWNNGTATLKLQTTDTREEIDIVYQIGNIDGEWIPYNEEIGITGLNHNETVYTAISDGTNVSKESSFNIKDGIAPTVTLTKGTVTTNSIAVSVSCSDGQSGISNTYQYYIKKDNDTNYSSSANYTGTSTSYTFSNLEPSITYDIKVTTKDIAGNLGSKTLDNVTTTAGATVNQQWIYTSNTTFTVPQTGRYYVEIHGRGGSGGTGDGDYFSGHSASGLWYRTSAAGGGGGGGGSGATFTLNLTYQQSYNITVATTNNSLTKSTFGSYYCNNGNNGGNGTASASWSSSATAGSYGGFGSYSSGGTNIASNGASGDAEESSISTYSNADGGKGGTGGDTTGNGYGNGGNGGSANSTGGSSSGYTGMSGAVIIKYLGQ